MNISRESWGIHLAKGVPIYLMLCEQPCPNISLDIYELTNSVVLVACGYYYFTLENYPFKREIEKKIIIE